VPVIDTAARRARLVGVEFIPGSGSGSGVHGTSSRVWKSDEL
jgi:hypothetical protein